MMIAARGDLRQVRDAEHLPALADPLQQPSDGFGDTAADAHVDLVEDQHGDAGHIGERDLHGERETRELAA